MESLYLGGGYFVPNEGQYMMPLAVYDENSEPGIIAATYGSGCVCLSGVHPEVEENNGRDGTDYWESHDDPDSEWDFMKKVSIWQIESSTWVTPSETATTTSTSTSPTETTTPPPVDPLAANLPILAVSGVLVVAVISVILMKRK
jgi:hypothetical protein